MKKLIGQIGKNISHNDIKRAFNFVVALFISFSFLISNFYIVKADTGSLIVEGGSIGTGGLSDLGGEIGTAALFAGLGLMAANYEVNLTNETLAQGKTPTQYITEQLTDWIDNSVMTYDEYVEEFLSDIQIAKNGLIYYGQNALDKIKQFGNWIVSNVNDNFVNRADINAGTPESVTVSDVSFLYTSECVIPAQRAGFRGLVLVRSDSPFLLARWGIAPIIISTNNTPVYGVVYQSDGGIWFDQSIALTHEVQTSDLYFGFWNITNYFQFNYESSGVPELSTLGYSTWQSAVNGIFGNVNGSDLVLGGSGADAQDCFIGTPSEWADFIPSLSLPDGYMGAIDAGVLDTLQGELDQTKDYVLTLEDYIQALEDTIDEQAADVPVVDVEDGQIVLVPDPPLVVVPEYEQVIPEDIPDEEELTPVMDPNIPADPERQIEGATITGLQDVFPFCIPFDVYNLLNKFTATPQAPRFQFDYTIPVVNTTLHYDFDFSGFNSVAAVLRTMELVAAIVGLALATRAIFIRS